MTKSQAKKLYGLEGTKRLRKQWTKARFRGRTPNKQIKMPNTKKQ